MVTINIPDQELKEELKKYLMRKIKRELQPEIREQIEKVVGDTHLFEVKFPELEKKIEKIQDWIKDQDNNAYLG